MASDPLQQDLQVRAVAKGFEGPAKATCNGCPWRKDAVPGALGGWTPLMYVEAAYSPADIACHMSKNFEGHVEKYDDAEANRPRSCAGLAAFRHNIGWAPGVHAHPDSSASIAAMAVTNTTAAEVFDNPNAFILHHEDPEGRKALFWREDRAGCPNSRRRA